MPGMSSRRGMAIARLLGSLNAKEKIRTKAGSPKRTRSCMGWGGSQSCSERMRREWWSLDHTAMPDQLPTLPIPTSASKGSLSGSRRCPGCWRPRAARMRRLGSSGGCCCEVLRPVDRCRASTGAAAAVEGRGGLSGAARKECERLSAADGKYTDAWVPRKAPSAFIGRVAGPSATGSTTASFSGPRSRAAVVRE